MNYKFEYPRVINITMEPMDAHAVIDVADDADTESICSDMSVDSDADDNNDNNDNDDASSTASSTASSIASSIATVYDEALADRYEIYTIAKKVNELYLCMHADASTHTDANTHICTD